MDRNLLFLTLQLKLVISIIQPVKRTINYFSRLLKLPHWGPVDFGSQIPPPKKNFLERAKMAIFLLNIFNMFFEDPVK